MATRRGPEEGGFTLIEVLVALAIVATALVAALRATGIGTVQMEDQRARLFAGWVAQNLITEHRAKGDWIPVGVHRGTVKQGGLEFVWQEEVNETPNASFRRVDIMVAGAHEPARNLVRLTGFVIRPPRGGV